MRTAPFDQLTESELHAAYIAGAIKRADYFAAIVRIHTARCEPGIVCSCRACLTHRETSAS